METWRSELYHSGKKGMKWGKPKRPRTEPYKLYGLTGLTSLAGNTYNVNPVGKGRLRNSKAYSKSHSTHYLDYVTRHISRGSSTERNPVGKTPYRNFNKGKKRRTDRGREFVKQLFG